MSLIPFIMDLADELNDFNRSLVSGMDVDDFGFGMYPNELQQTSPRRPRTVSQLYLLPNIRGRHHPYWRGSGNSSKACCHKAAAEKEATSVSDKESTVAVKPATAAYSVVNKNGFQVSMNVKQFSPNELTVKTIDNCIVVEGQHDEKEDGHGVISRHFVRKYMLPKGFDPNEVLSTLSSDGILTVKAPPPTKAEEQQLERVVHIQHTGPAQLSAKDVGASNKEKSQLQTPAAAATAITTTTQTPTPSQQQQQQPEEEEIQKVVNERNGDADANEINSGQETATETASIEPMLLVSNIVTAAAIDAIVSASAVATTAANEENKNENDTNIADIPMADVAVPAGVIESIVLVVPADNAAAIAEDGNAANADTAAAAAGTVGETPADDIVIPTPPTAGDLVAAADAAIILAKTQCENGTKAATEELAN